MGEGEVCHAVLNGEVVGNDDLLETEWKVGQDWTMGNTDSVEHPSKKQGKEASHEDVCSEVLNPTASPRGNFASYQTKTLNAAELLTSNQVGCADISPTVSESSSSDSLCGEDDNQNKSASGSASHVTLELPKHASSTSGIRKITFKFNQKKVNKLSASVVNNQSHSRGVDGDTDTGEKLSCGPNMKSEVSKRVSSKAYPTSVRKLLLTGILEGAKVMYISVSGENELCGFISGCGYLCGCSVCNFSKVVTDYEFEVHAGGKTRHPNNHIYLENGKPIYNVVHELRTTSLADFDEVIRVVLGPSINEDSFYKWRASLEKNTATKAGKKWQYSPTMHSSLRPNYFLSKSSIQRKRTVEGSIKKRDNDLHRLLFLPNGLPDGAELAYYAKGQIVLKGYKQGNGIFCSHCNCEISPSQFEAHAGWAVKRQPYRHIYTSNGSTLHDIAVSLATGQSITTSDSDDMCTMCGDGGDLILCHGCPRAFHAACLDLQCFPDGNWHCSYCSEKFVPGSRTSAGESTRPIMLRLTRVVKAPEFEPGGCVVCGFHDFTSDTFHERTVIICDQCEREFHVACLREIGRCDLKELPKTDWFCSDDCGRIHLALRSIVSCGTEMIPASTSNKIISKFVERGLMASESDVQWRIISGKNRLPEDLPFLSKATAIFRDCFDPIAAIAGRDLIPVMVYGRNISGQEFGGMYCVVLIVKSVVVSACLLRVFGHDAAELPLVATSRENQGKGYFQALFWCVEGLLSSLNVGTLVLPAAEEGKSIWTLKFGFTKMSEDRLMRFMKQFRPTMFKGTSMLEKPVLLHPTTHS